MNFHSHLNKGKVDYHWQSTTKHSVSSKLGTMSHAVVSSISR